MADTFKAVFPGQDLYEVLGVAKDATPEQIKKAYFKKALQWHPDKNAGDAEATKKFQALSWVHAFLSDPAKRKAYDETGSIEDAEAESESFEVWYDYWRGMFPAISVEQIKNFEASYRGSAEEAADVLAAYAQFEGDMDEVLDNVMCCTHDDEDRFVGIIQAAVAAGKVPAFDEFVALYGTGGKGPSKRGASAAARAKRNRASAAASEAREADEMLKDMKAAHVKKGGKAEDGLAAIIAARQADRARSMGGLLDSLAAKYGASSAHALEDGDMDEGGGGGGKKKRGGKGAGAGASSSAAAGSPPKRKK